MTATPAILINTKYLEDAETTQYTAPASCKVVHVDEFTVSNRTAGTVALIVRVVPSGGAPGPEHELFPSKILAIGEVYQLPYFALGPGDSIRTDPAGASSLVAHASGRIVT